MSRIPLLIAALPSSVKKGGPLVPIDAGKWRVIFKDVVNSSFHLRYSSPQLPINFKSTFHIFDGYEFPLEEQSIFNVLCVEPGSEKAVSIFLEGVK